MNSYPPLPKLVEEIIEWCSESGFPYGFRISWTLAQLEIVSKFLAQVKVHSNFSLRMYRKLCLDEAWQNRFKTRRYARAGQLVVSFMQDLGKLFKVPKHQQLSDMYSTLKMNELLVGFIRFLLELLRPHVASYALLPAVENRVVKELRYLVKILGDTPFRVTEYEEVQIVLEEFEQAVNRAGIFVHYLIFSPDAVAHTKNDALGIFLEHIQPLKANINVFLDFLPSTVITDLTPNDGVDSLVIVNSLLYELQDLMNQGDNLHAEVKDLIRKLHESLILFHSLLKEPQCVEIELKKQHMVQVIARAYDAESLIRSFSDGDAPLWYFNIRLTHHISNIQLNATGLQNIISDYDIGAPKIADDFSAQQALLAKKDFMADEIIVGFDVQEENLLDPLVRGTTNLQQIFFFGMSGIGKTTFAKKIYRHPRINCHFDRNSWCVVSQMYDRRKILIDILICISYDPKEDVLMNLDEEKLELEIYQSLKHRRYLIVLDDVWDFKVWDDLQFLPDDGNGSRILFTSRNKDVAPYGSILYELSFLSNDQCWELLEKKVFHSNPCPPQLYEIGKKIAAHCYGLPLVVLVIGGILSTVRKEESAWENVAQSLSCYMLADESSSMMQILERSYKDLPQHLKPCFLYLGILKEAEIYVKKLIQHWIAERFIGKEENKTEECVAEEYLKELINRSLVTVVKRRADGGAKICSIHDLLRDLCLRIAQRENFMKCSLDYFILRKRYLQMCVHKKPLYRFSHQYLKPYGQRTDDVVPCCFWESLSPVPNAKRLRILNSWQVSKVDLSGIDVSDLRYMVVLEIPVSLHDCVNLEFLIVPGPVNISSNILKMPKLKCIHGTPATFDGDCYINETCKVESISEVGICNQKDLEMLKCLPNLCKLKFYDILSRDSKPVTCLDFSSLIQLQSITVFFWSVPIDDLKFPSNIRKLSLGNLNFPWEMMAIIGALPSLQVLKLSRGTFLGERWDTSDGEFVQLRILKLSGLDLVQWNVSSSEHFPKLQQLILSSCYNLEEIPGEIGEIETMQLIEVRGRCRESLVDSAVQIQKEQLDLGNEVLRVDTQQTWHSGELPRVDGKVERLGRQRLALELDRVQLALFDCWRLAGKQARLAKKQGVVVEVGSYIESSAPYFSLWQQLEFDPMGFQKLALMLDQQRLALLDSQLLALEQHQPVALDSPLDCQLLVLERQVRRLRLEFDHQLLGLELALELDREQLGLECGSERLVQFFELTEF